jgi:hypothetical protein
MKSVLCAMLLTLAACGSPEQVESTQSEQIIQVTGTCPSWVTGRTLCGAPSRQSLCSYHPYPSATWAVYGCTYPVCVGSVCFNSYCGFCEN